MLSAKKEIDMRRQEINSKMDAQSKQAQRVYDKIDGAIADLGTITMAITWEFVPHACAVYRYQDWGFK